MQLYWNHTSAWLISSKFAAFLQNTFSEEHLRRAASGHLHYNKKHTISCFLSLSTVIIRQFHSYTKILTLILFIPTPSSPHSHPDSQHFPHSNPHSHHFYPDSLHSHPDFHNSPHDSPHSYPDSHHSPPDSHHSHPDSPHSLPDSLHSHLDSPHSYHSLHSVPRFLIPAFTDSRILKMSFTF